jgi:hypothetical protein
VLAVALASGLLAAVAVPSFAQSRRPGLVDPEILLTDAQINRIRQVELQTADEAGYEGRPPRIRFADRVVQRFVEAREDLDFRTFNQQNDVAKAMQIIADGNEEFVPSVQVLTDPGSLAIFKSEVMPAVLQTCAVGPCHSPDSGHGVPVLVDQGRTDEYVYTNFYSLVRSETTVPNPAGDAFGGPAEVKRKVIDRADPNASLLLQSMLPPELAQFPHPEVDGYQPLQTGMQDLRYQATRRWIAEALEREPGDYGFPADTGPFEAEEEPAADAEDES